MKNIIIIDDDQSFIDLVKVALKGIEDVTLHTALNVEDGFKKILSIQADLLILDIQLPESSGINISKSIDSFQLYGIPTVFVSSDSKYKKIISEINFQKEVEFVLKPINVHEFNKVLTKFLNFKPKAMKNTSQGFLKRPSPILLIGTFHLLEPLIKLLYLMAVTRFSFSQVLNNVLQIENYKSIFEFWFLFPIGGLALLSIKKYAYFLFLLVQSYAIFIHLTYESFTWPYVSEKPLLFSSVLLFLNVFILIYLLLPEVRKPFFDRRLRWWITDPRFNIKIPCELKASQQLEKCEIGNISKSGAFVLSKQELNTSENVELRFKFHYFEFFIRGKIISKHSFRGNEGYGIKFNFIQFGDKFKLRKFLTALKLLEVP